MSESPLRYFAYGSNMCTARLRARAPSARAIATAHLPGYELRFHKRGRDGSGKCNVISTRTDAPHAARVYGVIFEIIPDEKADLDRAEDLGRGYVERAAEVITENGTVTVFYYKALPEVIDDDLRPFDWYRDLVLAGAVEHELPSGHRRVIERVDVIADPDPKRARLHRAFSQRECDVE